MTEDEAYKAWWHNEGSGIIPLPNEDMEEFAHRITQIAWSNGAFKEREKILFAIKELRGRSQEPVAWMNDMGTHIDLNVSGRGMPLYTTPPQRKPLTDEEISEYAERMEASDPTDSFWREFAQAIESAHGIKE